MALQKQAFTGFTAGLWAAFKAKVLKDTGVEIVANSGTVQHGSFEFVYSYDSTAQVLTLQCLKKPLFLPASTIINGLAEEIAELREAPLPAAPVASQAAPAAPAAPVAPEA